MSSLDLPLLIKRVSAGQTIILSDSDGNDLVISSDLEGNIPYYGFAFCGETIIMTPSLDVFKESLEKEIAKRVYTLVTESSWLVLIGKTFEEFDNRKMAEMRITALQETGDNRVIRLVCSTDENTRVY